MMRLLLGLAIWLACTAESCCQPVKGGPCETGSWGACCPGADTVCWQHACTEIPVGQTP